MKTNSSHEGGRSNFFQQHISGLDESIFPAILHTLDEPLFLLDNTFRLAWHNKACNEIYEYVSGKPIDSSFHFTELLTKEQQPLFIEQLSRVQQEGERLHFEWKYMQSITKWLSVSLYPFKSANGSFTGIFGSLRDITEQKINELVLLRNTAVLNNISDAVIYTDLEQHVVYFNKSAEKIYGISAAEITGRLLFDFINYEYVDDTRDNAMQVILEKGNWQGKFIYTRKDGKKVYLLAAVTRLVDKNGHIIGLIATNKDITDEELNRQQALRHQDNINAIINNIEEGVVLLDCHFTMLTFNRRVAKLFEKINAKARPGANFVSLLPEYRRAPALQHLQIVLTGKSVEYEIEYPDGLWLLINYIPVKNDAGEITQISATFRNITKRKKAEEQTKANEKKYRTVVNSLSEGVILQTPDKQILTVNKSAESILGLKADELMQKGFPCAGCILIDEKEKEIPHEELFYKKNGKVYAFKNKVIGIRKTNYTQWLKLNAALVTNTQQNEPYAIVISFEDITEQKRLLGEMEVLALLARETANAVCILQQDGELLWINEGFTRFTGYTAEELVGKRSRAFMHGPETDMNIVKKVTYCRENGLPVTEEYLVYTKDGEKKWARVQGQAIEQSKGSAPKYFLIITDITEEKKIQQELEVLSMVAKETNNGIVIFDKKSGNTLWVNEGFTRLTGFTAQEMMGKNPATVLQGPETNLDTLKYMKTQISNNLSYSGEILIYTNDGRKRLHHLTGQPFKNVNGENTRYFAISNDITEWRHMEEERLQNEIEQQKEITHVILQTQEAERNELGRELHDNINQLLAAVHLQLSYSVKNFKISKPVIEQCVDNIKEAMEETRRLSHKMVMPLFLERSLQDVMKGLVENYRHTQNIQLETNGWCDETVPDCIKETFFRIAQEQLSNIYKHAKASKITIRLKNDAEHAIMWVEDNGVGFDPVEKRNGIGISNIRNRAESCHGTSQFISAPGNGCALYVVIPLANK